MTLLKKAYSLLTPPERRRAWLVVAFAVVVAIFESIGALSVMPFLAVLAEPRIVHQNQMLSVLFDLFGQTDPQKFLVLLGIASVTLMLISAAMRALGQYIVFRFSQLRAYSISRRLFEAYLRQPYAFHLSRHSGEMSQSLLGESVMLANQVYQPLTQLIAQLIVAVVLVGVLVVVDAGVALAAMVVLGSCYAAMFLLVRRSLSQIGQERMAANKARFRAVGETFGGIKTIKLLGLERSNLDHFDNAARTMAQLDAKTQTLGEVPRYWIEVVAFGGIISLALVLLVRVGDEPGGAYRHLLPLLGLYAIVGYRLMPAMQRIFVSLTQIRAGEPILNKFLDELSGSADLSDLPVQRATPLPFKNEVTLQGVTFRHEGAAAPTLEGIDLTLPKGGSLGIVGTTGAGKTTLMDVLLGLLNPESGHISVDNIKVTDENIRGWQSNLGYVPQELFLLDASIAENIAFGLEPAIIDRDRVKECARLAQLLEFVNDDLILGFDSVVGERGVRLSGGQRQRVGIARALYYDPSILVFDEATSALDNLTERAVVEAISALKGTKTIVIVAHRISTVQNCDQILVLNKGRIAGLGSFSELSECNAMFRNLLRAGEAA